MPPTAQQPNVALLALDLDFFKSVNDRYGHQIGDEVLIEFVERARSTVREQDVIVRDGGEEFVLVLPGASLEIATAAAQRICDTIRNTPFCYDISQTVSAGVAQWEVGETSESLRRRADQAMYRAKTTGRNRVCVSDPRSEVVLASIDGHAAARQTTFSH